jgi:DNA anti-recombination protein RmuC
MDFKVVSENNDKLEETFQHIRQSLDVAYDSFTRRRETILKAFEESQKKEALALAEIASAIMKIDPEQQSKI